MHPFSDLKRAFALFYQMLSSTSIKGCASERERVSLCVNEPAAQCGQLHMSAQCSEQHWDMFNEIMQNSRCASSTSEIRAGNLGPQLSREKFG